MNAACVLVSGGIESAVLVNDALSRYDKVTPVYVRNHLRWEDTEIFCLKNFLRCLKQTNLKPLAVLDLTMREYALLVDFVHHAEEVVSRADLLARVWSLHFDPSSNLVEVHVSRLREKLADHAWMIETVRGTGYRLTATRRRASNDDGHK